MKNEINIGSGPYLSYQTIRDVIKKTRKQIFGIFLASISVSIALYFIAPVQFLATGHIRIGKIPEVVFGQGDLRSTIRVTPLIDPISLKSIIEHHFTINKGDKKKSRIRSIEPIKGQSPNGLIVTALGKDVETATKLIKEVEAFAQGRLNIVSEGARNLAVKQLEVLNSFSKKGGGNSYIVRESFSGSEARSFQGMAFDAQLLKVGLEEMLASSDLFFTKLESVGPVSSDPVWPSLPLFLLSASIFGLIVGAGLVLVRLVSYNPQAN